MEFLKMEQQYPSKLLARAVEEFSRFPGVGRKTALRFVLHLLRQDEKTADSFCNAVHELYHGVKYCKVCHNISDTELCDICSSPGRDSSTICVVENVQDVLAIENTQQYNGLYHVLGGVVSPMDGIGPNDIEVASLVDRVAAGGIREVILALSPTMEGDTTNFYISRRETIGDSAGSDGGRRAGVHRRGYARTLNNKPHGIRRERTAVNKT